MYIAHDIKWRIIIQFAWRYLVFYVIYSSIICILHEYFDLSLAIPTLPLTIMGVAVSFYVGFKNNSSYERLWEARRIWGSIVNASRTFGIYVLDYINAENTEGGKNVYKELIHRHLAYINALRVQLRQKQIFNNHNNETAHKVIENLGITENLPVDQEIAKYLPADEVLTYKNAANVATQILRKQSEVIAELHKNGQIDHFKQIELGRLLANFYDQQGACERIKGFPFPRQYAYFSKAFVYQFVLMLPFGLINEFEKIGDWHIWLTIPAHALVSWMFVTMEMVGDNSENPFENSINDVPMTTICRTIEIDLRQMLGETDVPPRIQPVNDVLM
jgi:ion channel-forming bestrophin family protein